MRLPDELVERAHRSLEESCERFTPAPWKVRRALEAALSEGGEVVEALKRLNGEGRFSWQIPAYHSGPYLLIPLESKE